jgi:hypothetical protein
MPIHGFGASMTDSVYTRKERLKRILHGFIPLNDGGYPLGERLKTICDGSIPLNEDLLPWMEDLFP